jgi:hypothetical protein
MWIPVGIDIEVGLEAGHVTANTLSFVRFSEKPDHGAGFGPEIIGINQLEMSVFWKLPGHETARFLLIPPAVKPPSLCCCLYICTLFQLFSGALRFLYL